MSIVVKEDIRQAVRAMKTLCVQIIFFLFMLGLAVRLCMQPLFRANYSGRKAPSLGFGSGSSCSCRTCQRMRARMRCASWVRVRILWASCYVINTQPRGFGSRFARRQEGNFMSFGCFICASSPRFIQYTHTSLLLISKCNPESRWLSMVSLNTLNSWNSSSRTDKIVHI